MWRGNENGFKDKEGNKDASEIRMATRVNQRYAGALGGWIRDMQGH